MRHQWRKYLRARAPRYTSYPSALHFTEAVGPAELAAALGEIGLYEPVGLYAHVPFCRQLCWYCGCNMRAETRYERALAYVDALIAETHLVARALGGAGRPASVHFGGGSPNYLQIDDLARILDAFEAEFGLTDSTKLAIELDPRLMREGEDSHRLAALGFSRVSFGVQDFDPAVQKAINREQGFDMIERCVADIRAASIGDLSFDLVYGLPKQTEATFADTIAKTIALSPDRCAVFGYAHLPAALPRQRLIREEDLPRDDLRAELALLADSMLMDAGYRRVGFDHYVKPDNAMWRSVQEGRLKRNFQGFTDDVAEHTIGLGASAVSRIGGLLAQNAKGAADYRAAIEAGGLATVRGARQDAVDRAAAETIFALLCDGSADLAALRDGIGPAGRRAMNAKLAPLLADGVANVTGGRLAISDEAWILRRAVAAAVDPREIPAAALSAAV